MKQIFTARENLLPLFAWFRTKIFFFSFLYRILFQRSIFLKADPMYLLTPLMKRPIITSRRIFFVEFFFRECFSTYLCLKTITALSPFIRMGVGAGLFS